jgi:CheY-like chemotaxis protein
VKPKSSVNQGTRVLVIDDDEIVLQAIRDILEGAGYQVHCLASPIGATQVIMSQQIRAVVVDLNMPVMHGNRFITLLRSWDKIRDIPTVLISGAALDALESAAQQLPGVVTVSKQHMHRLLPDTLARLLAQARAQALSNQGAPLSPGTQRK